MVEAFVVPTIPHKVIIADVVYPAVLLAHGKSIALLLAMVAEIQSGLCVLTKSFCQVEVVVDVEGNPIIDSNGHPLVKTPNPRVELPYTYRWPGMLCTMFSDWSIPAGLSTICTLLGRRF